FRRPRESGERMRKDAAGGWSAPGFEPSPQLNPSITTLPPLRRPYATTFASASILDAFHAYSPGRPACDRRQGAPMLDILLLLLGIGGFALMALYVAACDRV
ncbi:MAG: hypothetical protein RMK90_13355, partial [Acetobacteraceae bacterium]|nr:hypothetical protein [Acetobacteraceae bacterium]